MERDLHDDAPGATRDRHESTLEQLTTQFADYLRSRTAGHWVMFLGGFVLGTMVG